MGIVDQAQDKIQFHELNIDNFVAALRVRSGEKAPTPLREAALDASPEELFFAAADSDAEAFIGMTMTSPRVGATNPRRAPMYEAASEALRSPRALSPRSPTPSSPNTSPPMTPR